MTEIPPKLRSIVLQYRFVNKLTFPEISRRVKGVTEAGARQFCYRTRKRAGSDNITKLLEASDIAPRSGAPRRIEPGLILSKRIRHTIRGKYRFQSQEEAAN